MQLACQPPAFFQDGQLPAMFDEEEVLPAAVNRGRQLGGGSLVRVQIGIAPAVDERRTQDDQPDALTAHHEGDHRPSWARITSMKAAELRRHTRIGAKIADGDRLPLVEEGIEGIARVGQAVFQQHQAVLGRPTTADDRRRALAYPVEFV